MAKPTPTEIAALVRAHSHRLHRFFSSSGVPRAEAQDLVQATFEVLLRKLDSPLDDVERYLWGIARTKLLQARTRLKTYEEFHQSHFAASTTTVSQKVDRRLRVSVLLARLDEEERTMFLMRCEGLTIEQIAAATEKARRRSNAASRRPGATSTRSPARRGRRTTPSASRTSRTATGTTGREPICPADGTSPCPPRHEDPMPKQTPFIPLALTTILGENDATFTKGAVKIRCRPRVTHRGGATKTAVGS